MNNGGPAFPTITNVADESGHLRRVGTDGMNLRDYFAAKAMQASFNTVFNAAATANKNALEFSQIFENLAITAYSMAEAMLKARQE